MLDNTVGQIVTKTSETIHIHFTEARAWPNALPWYLPVSTSHLKTGFPLPNKLSHPHKSNWLQQNVWHYWQELNRRSQHLSSRLCPCLKHNTVGRLFLWNRWIYGLRAAQSVNLSLWMAHAMSFSFCVLLCAIWQYICHSSTSSLPREQKLREIGNTTPGTAL